MPLNVQEASQISMLLKEKKRELGPDCVFDNEFIHCTAVTQQDLSASVTNLFKLIATSNLELSKIWEKIEKRGLSDYKTS
jgi:hypothetical protein